MNILLASDVSMNTVASGAERVIREQLDRLCARGHHVVHLTRRLPEHDTDCADIGAFREHRYEVDRRSAARFLVSSIRRGRALFRRLHRETPFDALVFHQPFAAAAVLSAPESRDLRNLYVCHSLAFEEYAMLHNRPAGPRALVRSAHIEALRRLERYALRRAERICVLSDYTRSKLRERHRVPPERVEIIPGGVDTGTFTPSPNPAGLRHRLGLPADRTVLFTVRNLEPRMGLENLLRAVAEARAAVPDLFLVVGGSGPLASELAALSARLGLDDGLRFTGFISEDLLPDYYRAADLFVLPTLDMEGFGLVTVESLSCGVPVLGTPVGGTREILAGLDPDLLFRNRTPAAMAEKIAGTCREMRRDPERWTELKRRCRDYAATHYDWEIHAKKIETLLASRF
ncbi:glycosyltransferase family 4 protein [Kiritimatiella glycovorans]|uniref:Glycosyltransferase n=1 Tax=Kiritimatiella glycovorans TaxID=1307763 RepID=A0A0G3EB20_9BACT|nr:glycosyltransferase family 4 protein [Kiritimatiella glycovorans]AKJ63483.1 Glycosyltransferase [Kiritimatiella glycovorans]